MIFRLAGAVFIVLLAGFLILLGGAWLPLQGDWVDRWASVYLSRATGVQIRLYDSRVIRWKQIQFGLLTITEQGQNKILLTSGAGAIRVNSGSFWGGGVKRFDLKFEDVVIMEDLCRKSPLIAWASKKAFDKPIVLKSVEGVLKKSAEGILSAHLLTGDSQALILRGGISFHLKHVVKVHALALLPSDRFEEVPKEIRARMILRKHRWRGLRFIYIKNQLTVIGQSGPFFQADWNHGQA